MVDLQPEVTQSLIRQPGVHDVTRPRLTDSQTLTATQEALSHEPAPVGTRTSVTVVVTVGLYALKALNKAVGASAVRVVLVAPHLLCSGSNRTTVQRRRGARQARNSSRVGRWCNFAGKSRPL